MNAYLPFHRNVTVLLSSCGHDVTDEYAYLNDICAHFSFVSEQTNKLSNKYTVVLLPER